MSAADTITSAAQLMRKAEKPLKALRELAEQAISDNQEDASFLGGDADSPENEAATVVCLGRWLKGSVADLEHRLQKAKQG